MLINVQTQILDYDDQPLALSAAKVVGDQEAPKTVYMTIGSMIILALNTPTDKDKDLPAADKVNRAVVSQDVHRALKEGADGNVNIDAALIATLKDLMNIFYAPLPLMRAFEILDPSVVEVPAVES